MLRDILTSGVVGVAVTTIAFLCTTVYLHRGISHRAISFARPVGFAFKTLVWLTTGIKVREWAAVHRMHHAYLDTERDPHSPAVSGWLRVQFGNLRMYRAAAHDPGNIAKHARDLPVTRWDRYLFDQSWLGLAITTAVLMLTLGWWQGGLAMVIHVNYYLAGSAAINAIGHHFGRRPYDNSATNNQWLAILVAGEGLHNNHHAAPTSAKLAHRWWEFDPGWLLIKPMTWLGLAKVRLHELKFTAGDAARAAAGSAREKAKHAAAAAKDAAAVMRGPVVE